MEKDCLDEYKGNDIVEDRNKITQMMTLGYVFQMSRLTIAIWLLVYISGIIVFIINDTLTKLGDHD